MNRVLYFVVGCVLVFAGYHSVSRLRAHAFAEAMQAEQAGYRLEHFEKEKLLFLHAPDGSKEGMPLDPKCMEVVTARMIPAEDNTLGKDMYRWEIGYVLDINGSWIRRNLHVPLFALEPAEVLRLVKLGAPNLDIAKGVELAQQVRRGDMDTAIVWAHPEFDGDKSPLPGMRCKPS